MTLIKSIVSVIKLVISLCLALAKIITIFAVIYYAYDLFKNGWSIGTAAKGVGFIYATYFLDKLLTHINKTNTHHRRATTAGKTNNYSECYVAESPTATYYNPSSPWPTPNYNSQPDYAATMHTIYDQTANTNPFVANLPENAWLNPNSDLNKSLRGGY